MDDLTAFLTARLDEDERRERDLAKMFCVDITRLLRDFEAKRAILAIHVPDEDRDCLICITVRVGYQEQRAWDAWPCRTVRLLAAVWSDHPDYRQEWKP